MAEYIDREKLLDELGESASYHAESGREYQLLLRDRNIVREQPIADVVERSKITKAKTNIEIMLEQEKQADGTYTEVGKGIAIALGLLKNEIGE